MIEQAALDAAKDYCTNLGFMQGDVINIIALVTVGALLLWVIFAMVTINLQKREKRVGAYLKETNQVGKYAEWKNKKIIE